ncbi:MAG TPA: hypothetical protein VNS56_14555, partial [Methylomirabilota bacterium]|nr:hypothetical protein [Methylomirabilota bacterium]
MLAKILAAIFVRTNGLDHCETYPITLISLAAGLRPRSSGAAGSHTFPLDSLGQVTWSCGGRLQHVPAQRTARNRYCPNRPDRVKNHFASED